MGKFTVIPETTFSELQMDAGVLLKNFNPQTGAIVKTDIITATKGGITASCVPTFVDDGEEIDNCPNNTLELKRVDGWECKMSTTAISMTTDTIAMSIGAADVDGGKITPRALKNADYKDVWWVGDLSDGGMVAIQLKNALSTSGFSLKTTKKAKGELTLEMTGHFSIENTDEVPMNFYIKKGSGN